MKIRHGPRLCRTTGGKKEYDDKDGGSALGILSRFTTEGSIWVAASFFDRHLT